MKRFLNTIILSCIAITAGAWWNNKNFYDVHFKDGTTLRGVITRTYTSNYRENAAPYPVDKLYPSDCRPTNMKDGCVEFFFNDENLYTYNHRIIAEQDQQHHLIHIKHTGYEFEWKTRDGFIMLRNVARVIEHNPPCYYKVYFTDGTVAGNFVQCCNKGLKQTWFYKGQVDFFTDNREDTQHNRLMIQRNALDIDKHVAYFGHDDERAKKYDAWMLVLKNVDRIECQTDMSCWW